MRMQINLKDFTKDGVCSRCTACCTDFIPLTFQEVYEIREFMKTHPVERTIRQDRATGDIVMSCPFLNGDGDCQIYEVRPGICRSFLCSRPLAELEDEKTVANIKAGYNSGYRPRTFKSLHLLFFGDVEYHNKIMIAIKAKRYRAVAKPVDGTDAQTPSEEGTHGDEPRQQNEDQAKE